MKLLFEIDKKDYDPNGTVFTRPSAKGIIFRDGKLSAIYSNSRDFYKIPGGGIEPGEDAVTAMIREIREEVGLAVIPETVREFGNVHRVSKGPNNTIFVQENYYYFCDVYEGQQQPDYTPSELKEQYEPRFVSLEEAIRVNEQHADDASLAVKLEREIRVMKLIQEYLQNRS